MKSRWRDEVAWRVLYRTIAPDDAYLSPAHGSPPHDRGVHTISLHQNQSLPYREFFDDIEPIFRAYEGRPHWGKVHTMGAEELRALYPRWDDFREVRARLDPHGVFLNPYLRRLFEVDA
jgi:FAD/FMN-containing dehydrogenase